MEPKGSVPCSQGPYTGSCPETDSVKVIYVWSICYRSNSWYCGL